MCGLCPAHGPVFIVIANEKKTAMMRLGVDKKAITQWARGIPV
jgi:hypothetical protein